MTHNESIPQNVGCGANYAFFEFTNQQGLFVRHSFPIERAYTCKYCLLLDFRRTLEPTGTENWPVGQLHLSYGIR